MRHLPPLLPPDAPPVLPPDDPPLELPELVPPELLPLPLELLPLELLFPEFEFPEPPELFELLLFPELLELLLPELLELELPELLLPELEFELPVFVPLLEVPSDVELPEFELPFVFEEPPALLDDVPPVEPSVLLPDPEELLGLFVLLPLLLFAASVAAFPVLPGPWVLLPGPPVSLAPAFPDEVVPLVPVPELFELLLLFELDVEPVLPALGA